MDQEIERHSVMDMIVNQSPCVALLKSMLMNPQPVRTKNLFVYEACRGIPTSDLTTPAQRKSMNAQPMIHNRVLLHVVVALADGPKMQPSRGD